MKGLLVNPRMSKGWRPYIIPSIGLCSLKAACKNVAEVKVLDASGMKLEDVKVEIKKYSPTFVGATSFTEARHNALDVLRVAKSLSSSIVTLLGGVHATHAYKQILENYPFVDIIFLGEGEVNLPGYFGTSQIGGIAYRGHGKLEVRERTFIKDLDDLPFPDYSDLDLRRYIDVGGPMRGKPIVAVETSRGCPYNCTFCSSRSVWGNVRFKSVGRILKELEYLVEKYNYKMVSFVDDIFAVNKNRTKELCKGMENFGLVWQCQTRTDSIDIETLQAMKSAGCYLIAFGVESGAPSILENINKRESREDIKNAFKLCKEVGVEAVFNVIVGCPGETKGTLEETRQLIRECRPTGIGTAALRAYPGSQVWALGLQEGLFTEDVLLTDKESIHYEGALSLKQMYRELIKFRFLQAQLRGIRGWVELLGISLRTLISTPGKVVKGVLQR